MGLSAEEELPGICIWWVATCGCGRETLRMGALRAVRVRAGLRMGALCAVRGGGHNKGNR